MTVRILYFCLAFTMMIASGCHSTRSSYRPATQPSVVAVAPIPAAAPCPTPCPNATPVPPPPPGAIR